jgi:hypothetical protein
LPLSSAPIFLNFARLLHLLFSLLSLYPQHYFGTIHSLVAAELFVAAASPDRLGLSTMAVLDLVVAVELVELVELVVLPQSF